MRFKPGVPTDTLQPVMQAGIDALEQVYKEMLEATVTSTTDGKHMAGSLHYKGLAVDIRTRYLSEAMTNEIYLAALRRLPPGFQLVHEDDHFHLEYDP